jgi:tripartite-type tricarboxylate transporter receptor subunit TctC
MKRVLLCVLALFVAGAAAQDFPSQPVRIVVPWPPSGNVDITARTVADQLDGWLQSDAVREALFARNAAILYRIGP